MNDKSKRFRDLIVLTSEEKRVVVFVMLMLLLGVGVKEYREGHPPVPVPAILQKNRGLRRLIEAGGVKPDASIFAPTPRQRPARTSHRKARTTPPAESPSPIPSPENDDGEASDQKQAPP